MRVISEALSKWQVDRLEALVRRARRSAKNQNLRGGAIVMEHLNLAEDHLDDAVAALKYSKFRQASYACHSGFFQLGLAELLIRYGGKIDAGIKALSALEARENSGPEEELLAAYLASCLAEMKVSIEYTNCRVSLRAQRVLDRAMDFYNDALKLIADSESGPSTAASQAGLLCLLLASALIGAENQIALPGLQALSNPMLTSPLRRAPELVSELAESRRRLHQREQAAPDEIFAEEKEKTTILRQHWEKAFNNFLQAVFAHAKQNNLQAKKLLRASRRDLEVCLDILGVDDPGDLGEEFENKAEERLPVVDVSSLLSEVKTVLEELKQAKLEYQLLCLSRIEEHYKEASKNFNRENFAQAEKSISEAALELDLLRQQLLIRKQKLTGAHSRFTDQQA